MDTEGTITALNESNIGTDDLVMQVDVLPNENYWNMYHRKRAFT